MTGQTGAVQQPGHHVRAESSPDSSKMKGGRRLSFDSVKVGAAVLSRPPSVGRVASVPPDGGGRFYGDEGFHPRLIITQIVFLQSTFYLLLVTSGVGLHWLCGYEPMVEVFFIYRCYTVWNTRGVCIMVALLLNAALM